MDFGIARSLEVDRLERVIIGTPAYMSPEQAAGKDRDARSDIYRWADLLRDVTGRPAFAPTRLWRWP